MDGHFAPNITVGPLVVEALRPLARETGTTLDVHLMIEDPDAYLDDFARAGADRLTVHVEAARDLNRTVGRIHEVALKAVDPLNPATPLTALQDILLHDAVILVMSVDPL